MTLKSDVQSLKENWLVVSNMTLGIWWFSTNHSKVQKFYFDGLFLSKVFEVWDKKKYRGVIFHDTEKWCKIWINPYLVVLKMAWGIGWTFIRAHKSLKKCTLMGSFCPKHIMFLLENFKGILCHGTEGCCNTKTETDLWFEKWHKEFG